MFEWLDSLGFIASVGIFVTIAVAAQLVKMIWFRRSRSRQETGSLRLDVTHERLDPARWHLAHTVFAGGFVYHTKALGRLLSCSGNRPADSRETVCSTGSDKKMPLCETSVESARA